MKWPTCLPAILFTATVYGQTRDRRAELDIQGRVEEVSVSPDEKIWLVTAVGNTYYTNRIDSNWHYGKPLFESTDPYAFENPNLDRVSFFNKDTAIITGYIGANKKRAEKNGYYLTKDAGKTWKLLDYGGDSWIYTLCTDKQGNAWMGGLSREVYYSNNFGKSWKTLKIPYKNSDRTYAIYMADTNHGTAGSDDNELLTTADNWNTVHRLPTPLDQKKYKKTESGYSDNRISRIQIWDSYIVVNQSGRIFYSDTGNIDWKTLPVAIHNFASDRESKTLFAITDSFKVVAFTSPNEFLPLTNKPLSGYPLDIKVVNHSAFVLSARYEVYKVNKNGMVRSIPWTTDKKIKDPEIIKQGTRLTWGINGNQIYLADDNKRDWYRENVLDIYVSDFMLKNDSVAILWDGYKNNYIYSLKDPAPKKYTPEFPLQAFLASPLSAFLINSGSRGCFHYIKNEVRYERINDSVFAASTVSTQGHQNNPPAAFNNSVNGAPLVNALAAINADVSAVPPLKDFQITEADRKRYLALVNKRLKGKESDPFDDKKAINKQFYYSVPSMLDTLSHIPIEAILDQQEEWTSTTSNWFSIQIINQNNDTLQISRNYYITTLPWNLPWKFEYKGIHFNCYSIDFSRFISSCIPDDFRGKEVFDNSALIMEIADYLWGRKN